MDLLRSKIRKLALSLYALFIFTFFIILAKWINPQIFHSWLTKITSLSMKAEAWSQTFSTYQFILAWLVLSLVIVSFYLLVGVFQEIKSLQKTLEEGKYSTRQLNADMLEKAQAISERLHQEHQFHKELQSQQNKLKNLLQSSEEKMNSLEQQCQSWRDKELTIATAAPTQTLTEKWHNLMGEGTTLVKIENQIRQLVELLFQGQMQIFNASMEMKKLCWQVSTDTTQEKSGQKMDLTELISADLDHVTQLMERGQELIQQSLYDLAEFQQEKEKTKLQFAEEIKIFDQLKAKERESMEELWKLSQASVENILKQSKQISPELQEIKSTLHDQHKAGEKQWGQWMEEHQQLEQHMQKMSEQIKTLHQKVARALEKRTLPHLPAFVAPILEAPSFKQIASSFVAENDHRQKDKDHENQRRTH